MNDDTRKRIIDALSLSPQAGGKLVEALDARYERHKNPDESMTSWKCDKHPEHGVQVQIIVDPAFGIPETPRCTVLCDQGYGFPTPCGRPLVMDLGPLLGMVPETTPAASPVATEPDVTELPGSVLWGVWCTPIPTSKGRNAAWLGDDDGYVLRSTIEAIAAELSGRAHAKHWRYEARPVMADGSPGPVPNDTIRARFELPSPEPHRSVAVGAHPTEDSLRAGCACSACVKADPPKASAPVGQNTQATCMRCGGFPALCNCP